ncbi:hypothetical protein EPK84_20375 [Sinorhizobium fredii]|nr:hypothetical protein EPK84_20375 [Sinorhizobium fredii]
MERFDGAAFRHLCQWLILTSWLASRPFARSLYPSQVWERRNSADFAVSFRARAPYARTDGRLAPACLLKSTPI